MARERTARIMIETASCTGTLTTKWAHGSMGTISGVEFKADVSTRHGDASVTFIVRSLELEDDADMEWLPLEPENIPHLEQLEAQHERPHRSRLN